MIWAVISSSVPICSTILAFSSALNDASTALFISPQSVPRYSIQSTKMP